MTYFKKSLCAVGLVLVSACGGGMTSTSGLEGYAAQFANLSALDTTLFTPEANLPTTSANYSGVANISVGGSATSLNAYLGELNVSVDFAGDTLSGSIDNFANYTGGSVTTPVDGMVTISNGNLTGNNTGIGDGLTAEADGTIDGHSVDMDVEGHFFDSTGDGLALYFDGAAFGDGGVGLATR